MKIFDIRLDLIKQKNLVFILIPLYALVIFFSILWANIFFLNYSYIMDNSLKEIIPRNLPFHYGPIVQNLIDGKGFFFDELYNTKEIIFYLKALPFVPMLFWFLLSISKNIYFFVILKNIIFFSIFFYISFISLKSNKAKLYEWLFILSYIFFIPYNLKNFLDISSGEFVTTVFVVLIFLLLNSNLKNKNYIIGVLLFILYLTKESMFFLCIALPFGIILFEKKDKMKNYFPLIMILIAALSWGIFGLKSTGKFPFGASISTWKSFDMSKAIHNDFLNYYPEFSTDFIDPIIRKEHSLKNTSVNNEWEFYEYFKERNIEQFKSNKKVIFKNTLAKIKFIFFNIQHDGKLDKNRKNSLLIIISNVINKIIFNLSLGLGIYILYKKINKKISFKEEFFFFLLIICNIFPHIVGWATTKHLIGISIISFIYLSKNIMKNKIKIKFT
jgi:hypothetical protein